MNTKNNKNNTEIIDTLETSYGFINVMQFDNGNRYFTHSDNKNLKPEKWTSLKANLLIRFLADLEDKLIINNVKKLNNYLEPLQEKSKYFIKEIKHLESGKTMDYIEFKKEFSNSQFAKNNNLTFKDITPDIILDYVKTNQNNWEIKLEDNNSNNSLFDNDKNDVVDMFQNDMKNNQFEGSKNVSKKLFTKDEIIKLNLYLDNEKEDVKSNYGIKRNFNSQWNTETSKSLDKYIKYYDDVVNKKSTSNNNNVVSNNSNSLEL
tara:strand:+ start:259 stop:1044 length:786 start_codon:yes stop_codon:yes gene_type:complete